MKLLNIREIMERANVSRATVYNWTKNGKLPPPVKRFGSPMWREDQIALSDDVIIVRVGRSEDEPEKK